MKLNPKITVEDFIKDTIQRDAKKLKKLRDLLCKAGL
jgi:hypothetical protein